MHVQYTNVSLPPDEDMRTLESDTDWQFVTLGDQQSFGIRTAGLEEKATACQMLVCYARELKEGFANFAEEVVKIMVPLLKFYFHDDILCSRLLGDCFLIHPNGIRIRTFFSETAYLPLVLEIKRKLKHS